MARATSRGSALALATLLVGCAIDAGEMDAPFGAAGAGLLTATVADHADRRRRIAGGLDMVQWGEPLDAERAVAEQDGRYLPRELRSGVALSQPAGPSAWIRSTGATLSFGDREVQLSVVSVGRRDHVVAAAAAEPTVHGAEARREVSDGIEEWWQALPSGLEHGLTLLQPPSAGEGLLTIDVAVRGVELHAVSEDVIALVDPRNVVRVATYSSLLVTDADGARVPARMAPMEGGVRIEVDDVSARYPLVVDPLVAVEEATLLGSGGPHDGFGGAVALTADGSRAAVGAMRDDRAGMDAGSVRVFLRMGTSWLPEATLFAAGAEPVDAFGRSVALTSDGSRMVVGTEGDDTTLPDTGSARVFLRSGTTWTEEATLLPADAATNDSLGYSVAVSADGTCAVVGAVTDDTPGGFAAGSARVFVRSGTTWTQEAVLLASGAGPEDQLGRSVAVASDCSRAVVGAYGDDTAAGRDAGSARVFVRTGSLWTEEALLLHSGAAPEDLAGWSVALSADGSRALVGVPWDDTPAGVEAGSVRVFVRDTSGWAEEAVLLASGASADDRLGEAVAISADGSRVLAGVRRQTTAAGTFAGTARVFVRSGTRWTEERTLLASGAAAWDQFGTAVALSADGDLALVGARLDDTPVGENAGSARVFRLRALAGTPCSTGASCESSFCVDGVCCDTACGGGASDDCRACSAAAGATADGTCTVLPDGASCADEDLCNGDEICTAGSCTLGSALDCDDDDACTADACDPAVGCGHSAIEGCCNEDADCDDGDPCTRDACSGLGGTCSHDVIASCGRDGGTVADGGSESDAGTMPDAGRLPDGGAGPEDAGPPAEETGCACSLGRRSGAPVGSMLWLGLAILVVVVRRR